MQPEEVWRLLERLASAAGPLGRLLYRWPEPQQRRSPEGWWWRLPRLSFQLLLQLLPARPQLPLLEQRRSAGD